MNDYMMEKLKSVRYVEQNGATVSTNAVKETKTKWNCKHWLNLEVVVLCVLLIGVWSLLSLPVIFYHLPVSELSSEGEVEDYISSVNGLFGGCLRHLYTFSNIFIAAVHNTHQHMPCFVANVDGTHVHHVVHYKIIRTYHCTHVGSTTASFEELVILNRRFLVDDQKSSSPITNETAASGDSMCSAPLKYDKINGICLRELANILASSNCLPDLEGNVLVVRNEEATATQLMNGLTSIGASVECRRKAVPFLCQHLFGLCSESGVSIQPTSSQCEEIRDTACLQEWITIEGFGMELPDCAKFPPEASSCPALHDNQSTFDIILRNILEKHQNLNGTTVAVLECSEGFYQENGSSVCSPSCYTLLQYNKALSIFLDVVAFTTAFIAFVAGAAVIIISCLLHKRMLSIPSIFIVYMMLDTMGLGLIVMVGYMDHNKLFCSSRNLIESLGEVTPFCVINGIIFTYMVSQVTLWWLFHVISIFLKVVFPFSSQFPGKVKFIHIVCVIIGILLPLLPVITSMAKFAVNSQKLSKNSTFQLRKSLFLSGGLGFGPTRFPPIFCSGSDPDAVFYSFALFVNIGLASGCTLLLVIFWSVHKLYKGKRTKQNFKSKINEAFKFETAEKKLLIVFCYYVILAVIFLTQFTLTTRNAPQLKDSFEKYFFCEQRGNSLCNRSAIENLNSPLLEILSDILLALLPVVNLLYAVNVEELKELWRKQVHKSSVTNSPL